LKGTCPSGWLCPTTTTPSGTTTATIVQWGQCGGKEKQTIIGIESYNLNIIS
jgi:hypothetical protein